MYVFGGSTKENGPTNSLFKMNLDSFLWERVEYESICEIPQERELSSITAFENQLWLVGGTHHTSILDDVKVFDTETRAWSTKSPFFPRCAHTAARLGSRLVVFGGTDGKDFLKYASFLANGYDITLF
jgi:N-acetylneuraminic acid mutarotase